jgi:phosphatidylserine decarboxylase
MLAYLPKASELNEHSTIAIKNDKAEILFKQLAGTFARRIVSYADPGTKGVRGEQCGIIKFGSRIDMYLPLDADIKVKIGDKVRASETIIAELR